jgi:hypothetical protein
MIPAEDVCTQQGLQPGTPEYDACVEQEQKRQAALIQAIMVKEQAPAAESVKAAVEPYDTAIIEPAPETLPEPTLLPELPAPTEPTPPTEPTITQPVAESISSEPTPATTSAEEQPERAAALPIVALQQSFATKLKPQAAAETATNECSGQMTHHEFAAVDGCMATVEIDETGDAIEPTVFPRECAPSAEDMKRL